MKRRCFQATFRRVDIARFGRNAEGVGIGLARLEPGNVDLHAIISRCTCHSCAGDRWGGGIFGIGNAVGDRDRASAGLGGGAGPDNDTITEWVTGCDSMEELNLARIWRRLWRNIGSRGCAGGNTQGSGSSSAQQAASSDLGHGSLPCSEPPLVRSVDNSMTIRRKFVYKRHNGHPENYCYCGRYRHPA